MINPNPQCVQAQFVPCIGDFASTIFKTVLHGTAVSSAVCAVKVLYSVQYQGSLYVFDLHAAEENR